MQQQRVGLPPSSLLRPRRDFSDVTGLGGHAPLRRRFFPPSAAAVELSAGTGEDEDSSGDDQVFVTQVGTVDMVTTSEAETDVFGESTYGNLHFSAIDTATLPPDYPPMGTLSFDSPEDILDVPYSTVKQRVQETLKSLHLTTPMGGLPTTYPAGEPQRAIFCSRKLQGLCIPHTCCGQTANCPLQQ